MNVGSLRVAARFWGAMGRTFFGFSVQPIPNFDGESFRRFSINLGGQACQRFLRKAVSHGLFGAQHRAVNCAYAVCCPSRCVIAKYGTTITNLLAIKQRLDAFNSIDNIKYRNIGWRFGQAIPPAHPLLRVDNTRLFQLGENLGDKRGGNALKFRKITTAGSPAGWVNQP